MSKIDQNPFHANYILNENSMSYMYLNKIVFFKPGGTKVISFWNTFSDLLKRCKGDGYMKPGSGGRISHHDDNQFLSMLTSEYLQL